MIVKLLTEPHLECLSLKGGSRASSESTHVKIPHCWKSHALAHLSSETLSIRRIHVEFKGCWVVINNFIQIIMHSISNEWRA